MGGGGRKWFFVLFVYLRIPFCSVLKPTFDNHYIQIHLSYIRFMSIHLSIYLFIYHIHVNTSIYLSFIYHIHVYPSIYIVSIRFMSIYIFIILFYLSTDISIYYKYICQIITFHISG